ncbi:MAG: thiamine diphosphokinase [bacterium]|nr:thiamine diphosphokinase [bacterium]
MLDRDILIFANGDANDGAMVQRAIQQAHHPLIAAADGGARIARHYGLTPQVVIGDMDSLTPDELHALEAAGAEIYRYPQEKNETDLELVLLWAARADPRRIRVIGAVGDRLDQTMANVYLLALPALRGIDVRICAGKQETWLALPGSSAIQGAPGDTVSLIPLGGGVRGVRTENLYYPLKDEDLPFGPARGVSNVLKGERGVIHVRDGVLLVVHTVGRA